MDEKNSKAFFRRGQAHMCLNEYELGLADLKSAENICPRNRDVINEINNSKRLMQSYLSIEKAACRRMFK